MDNKDTAMAQVNEDSDASKDTWVSSKITSIRNTVKAFRMKTNKDNINLSHEKAASHLKSPAQRNLFIGAL